MIVKRYIEHYREDAIRLAALFGEKHHEFKDKAACYGFPPKAGVGPDDEVSVVGVEVDGCLYAIAYLDASTPTDPKLRNKSFYRVLVGRQIREKRERGGKSLDEVASVAGFTPHALERIEEGRWDIDLGQLGRILEALNATINIG